MPTRKRDVLIDGPLPAGSLSGQRVDELDVKILQMLLAEGRVSAREMHYTLGVSTSTVIARIDRLRRRGFLRGFTAVVDFQRLG